MKKLEAINRKTAEKVGIKLAKRSLYYATMASVLLLPLSRPALCGSGSWSTETISLVFSAGIPENPRLRDIVLTAPDNRKRIIVKGYELRVEVDGKRVNEPPEGPIGVFTLAEVGWASDSCAFFITQSDGGAVGTWNTDAYLSTPLGLRKVAISDGVRKDFMKRYNCEVWWDKRGNEIPNIAGLKWLKGSRELLLVAEVPPHSSCPEMGKFMGYVVSVPSAKIVARYSAREVRTRWGQSLGPRHNKDEEYDSEKNRLQPWPK